MKRITTVLLCVMLLFSSGLVLLDVQEEAQGRIVEQDGLTYTHHAPVRINGDLSLSGFATSGDGSPGNPWIIEGWEIDGDGYLNAFYIGNTTDYFVLRDCYIHRVGGVPGGSSSPYYKNSGLVLYNVQNGIINNNSISSNEFNGMYIYESNNIMITNNTASNNMGSGISLVLSDIVTISGNSVVNNVNGIRIQASDDNNINNNSASNNWINGISLESSINNKVENNTMSNDGICLYGDQLLHWTSHAIDTSNLVNGKPAYYLKNLMSGTVPQGAGEVILANCLNVVVEDQSLSNCFAGVQLGFSEYCTISNNNVSNNYYGIYFQNSDNNTISDNIASEGNYGFSFWTSSNNSLTGNIVSENSYGFIVNTNKSKNNVIYKNIIIDNSFQAWDYGANLNYWDNGYPDGGNYWSDYNGVDTFSGPNQDQPGADKIGDTPYTNIDGDSGAQDNYPQMDLSPPVITLNSPLNNSLIAAGTTVDISVEDAYLAYVNCSIDGGASLALDAPYDIDTTGWSDGNHTAAIHATDSDGREAIKIYGFSFDSTGPNIDLASPLNNSVILADTVINLTVFDEHQFTVKYSINGGTEITLESPYSINTTGWSDGTYKFDVHAIDIIGNAAFKSYNFTVDDTSPIVASKSPAHNSVEVSISPTIQITFSEKMNMSSVEQAAAFEPSIDFYSLSWENDTILSITFSEDLNFNTSYLITISTNATDFVGNSLNRKCFLSFTTQIDSDGDGTPDAEDLDDDDDGVPDTEDAFPLDSAEAMDTDDDGTGNNADSDDDGDGVLDSEDTFPLDETESVDTDDDGIGNNADTDDDGDGVPDEIDEDPLDPEVGEAEDDPGRGSNLLWIIILLIVVAIAGAALFLRMRGKPDVPEDLPETEEPIEPNQ